MSTDQALVVAGHGSHHDSRSASPVHTLADRIRRRRCFDAVRAAFWKEQPSLAEVLSTVETESVYVVPLLMGEGYFADRVFPLELGLRESDPTPDQGIYYTAPVGTHERLQAVIVERIEEVLSEDFDRDDVGVAIVGHGTERHERSADATVAHADRLRADGRYGEVEALFLDQSPNVAEVRDRFERPNVVIVPLFVSHGLHVMRDVPAAAGLPAGHDAFGGPTRVDGKRLWYTGATGTAPGLSRVVLDRAAAAGADTRKNRVGTGHIASEAETAFLQHLEHEWGGTEPSSVRATDQWTVSWGELTIIVRSPPDGGRRYAIRHTDDQGRRSKELDRLETVAGVRDRAGVDDAGQHRPLRTARTLPRGWLFETSDPTELIQAARAVYPASIDLWCQDNAGPLTVTDFESVITRQAGRYGDLDTLDSDTLKRTVGACCGDCVRERRWDAAELPPVESDGPMPCPEPCSFLLESARTFGELSTTEADESIDPTVPAAAFDRPGNRYRVRFQQLPQDDTRHTTEPTTQQ